MAARGIPQDLLDNAAAPAAATLREGEYIYPKKELGMIAYACFQLMSAREPVAKYSSRETGRCYTE
jgi:hypothetical protein